MFRKITLLVFLILSLLLAACGGNGAKPDQVPPAGAGQEQPQAEGAPLAPTDQPDAEALVPTALIPETGAATPTSEPATPAAEGTPVAVCPPTEPDMLGPFYTPGAPERDAVGSGYVLSGVVRSSQGCVPIPDAQIEVWMAGPDGVYTDDYRATLYSGADGAYRFESPVPVPYGGRPPHIHLRITAPGHTELVTQHYPQEGETEAVFDVVLVGGQ